MKILHIVSGELTGGAARGAYWLHLGLKELGINSTILTSSTITFGDKNIVSSSKSKIDKLKSWVRRQIDQRLLLMFYLKREKMSFSSGLFGINFTKTREYADADIIHLHWINHNYINMKHLSTVTKPVLWTMRDMWPMTGGCYFPEIIECEKYKTGCGNCTQLHSNLKYDLSKYIFWRKNKFLPKKMKLVGISSWLSNKARESKLFKNSDIRTISNNINARDFFPIDKQVARSILGIATDKKIILAGSVRLSDLEKGFNKYLEAIKILNKEDYYLCFFGHFNQSMIESLGFEYRSYGFLHDNASLRLVYSAADIFVSPSLQEAFGKTIAEAMACGTPAVCFDATGPKDIVTHKIDGYKAIPFDSDDLAAGVEWVVNNKKYDLLCENARKNVARRFDSIVIAKQYLELYKEMLNK